MSTPPDHVIRAKMEKLVAKVDLETMTTKQFISLLSKKMGGADLSKKKKFIKASITEILDAMAEEEEDSASSGEEEEESSEEEEEQKPKKRNSGLTAVKLISDDMAAFLGKGKKMARTELVKGLWEYIKKHDLQNPNDRREILLDGPMKKLFGVDKVTMFSINKYVGAHIHPFKPVDLDSNTSSATPRKRKAAQQAKKGKEGDAKKSRKQGGQAPYRLSDALARVVGKDILPRPQVTQALWAYIRKHNLQNPEDKREILCDELLRKVMGQSKVTMFTMNRLITPHLLEKVDKSEYTHEDIEKSESENESNNNVGDDSESEQSESEEESEGSD
mmetsp:Transcript_24692/g.35905  ORF Transcript_24692/g.35905 Transcript_24692/m.35905 type:complete len:332 (+) Transcript_24692:93-1088(+)